MNMENITEKKSPEAARTGAASTVQADAAKMSQAAYVAARTPLGLLLGGAAVVLALMVTLLTLISIDRSEAAMARLLAERARR